MVTECLRWRLIPDRCLDRYRLVLKEESGKHSLGHQNLQQEHPLACASQSEMVTQKSFHHRRRSEIRNAPTLGWNVELLRENIINRQVQHQL